MKREKQLFLENLNLKSSLDFGGSLLKNSHAKTPRPISTKRVMHAVLRASVCKGPLSFLLSKNSKVIDRVLESQGLLHGVKIYKVAKAHNHIHLVLLPRSRESFIAFLRSITGLIPRLLLGAQKGSPIGKVFWDKRPWSRIISWGKEYKLVLKYLEQNMLEAFGFIPYQERKTRFSSA